MRLFSSSALVALGLLVAPSAFASHVVQCQYAATVVQAPALTVTDGPGRHVALLVELGRLTRPGGHDPSRCNEMPMSGKRAIEMSAGTEHSRELLKPGAEVEVVFTDVFNVVKGPDGKVHRMRHTEWTLVPPKRPPPQVVDQSGRDE